MPSVGSMTAGTEPLQVTDFLYLYRSASAPGARDRKFACDVLVTKTAAQTLTNKTLTAPTLNGTPVLGSPSDWRTALGLGSVATQSASAVSFTGGTINGAVIGGTTPAAITGTTINATSAFQKSGTQVVAARKTGWGSPAGTLDRSAYTAYAGATMSVGYVQAEAQATNDAVRNLARVVAALLTDLHGATSGHGLIGT